MQRVIAILLYPVLFFLIVNDTEEYLFNYIHAMKFKNCFQI